MLCAAAQGVSAGFELLLLNLDPVREVEIEQ